MADLSSRKRERDGSSESDPDPVDVKKLRDDLLSFLDDSDPNPTTLDLDSVMKSFENEITPASYSPVLFIEQWADSQLELGYLLEASDDELGIPPSVASTSQQVNADESEMLTVPSDSSGMGEFWGFEDELRTYDAFDLASEDETANQMNQAEYVACAWLFDQSDVLFFEPADKWEISDFLAA